MSEEENQLTSRQQEAVNYYIQYRGNLTRIAEVMGISREAVRHYFEKPKVIEATKAALLNHVNEVIFPMMHPDPDNNKGWSRVIHKVKSTKDSIETETQKHFEKSKGVELMLKAIGTTPFNKVDANRQEYDNQQDMVLIDGVTDDEL